MNQETKDNFVKQLSLLKTINLPYVAKQMGINWFKDLKPELQTDVEFKAAIEDYLEELKYDMLQGVLNVGVNGKTAGFGKNPELSYIREAIKFIDSGVILGKIKEGDNLGDSVSASLISQVTGNSNLAEQK